MIVLGYAEAEKSAVIAEYVRRNGIEKIAYIWGHVARTEVPFDGPLRRAPFEDSDKYENFYPFLQMIDRKTLVILDECLRLQNRGDIKYNCFRHYLAQTPHQLVFQYLPLIDSIEDFMILFDLDTKSRWRREKFRASLLAECEIRVRSTPFRWTEIPVSVDEATRSRYAARKRALIDGIGLKDPHTIPRNLYLESGRSKLPLIDAGRKYIGRNGRFAIPNLRTYREADFPDQPYTVFEFCHNFIDFSDFVYLSRQSAFDVLVADLPVDRWYLDRYQKWGARLHDAFAAIRPGRQECA